MTKNVDVDRKTKNIVVICLRPYKGYGLLRVRETKGGDLATCFSIIEIKNYYQLYVSCVLPSKYNKDCVFQLQLNPLKRSSKFKTMSFLSLKKWDNWL